MFATWQFYNHAVIDQYEHIDTAGTGQPPGEERERERERDIERESNKEDPVVR